MTAIAPFAYGIALVVGTKKVGRDLPLGLLVLLAVVVVVALAVRLARGVEICLTFGGHGITRRDLSGRHVIRWSEAKNFHTKRMLFTTYLVAEPAEVSTWFLGPWGWDEHDQVIRICDLTSSRISAGKVDAALKYWENVSRSR